MPTSLGEFHGHAYLLERHEPLEMPGAFFEHNGDDVTPLDMTFAGRILQREYTMETAMNSEPVKDLDYYHEKLFTGVYEGDFEEGEGPYQPGWKEQHPIKFLPECTGVPLWYFDFLFDDEGEFLSIMRLLGQSTCVEGGSRGCLEGISQALAWYFGKAPRKLLRAAFTLMDGALETNSMGGLAAAKIALQVVLPWVWMQDDRDVLALVEHPPLPKHFTVELTDNSMATRDLEEWRVVHVPLYLRMSKVVRATRAFSEQWHEQEQSQPEPIK
jgi:hypothetical protein